MTTAAKRSAPGAATLVGGVLLLSVAGALIVYKSAGAMKAIARAQETGSLSAKARWISIDAFPAWAQALADTLNYFSWIFIALAFGVVIGAIVRAALPSSWIARVFGSNPALGIVGGAAVGAPLMLCSCCVSPVFDGTYARTRKLGPSLAMMFAAPGLNPADLAITFLVFPRPLAIARLALTLTIVLGASALLGHRYRTERPPELSVFDQPAPTWGELGARLWEALGKTARTSLPAMIVGVILSALLVTWLPVAELAGASELSTVTLVVIAAVATLIALPTFGEIPLGLALLLAGAPTAAVLAVLVAGPIINLPSLMVLRRTVSARAAAAVGTAVFAVSVVGSAVAARLVA